MGRKRWGGGVVLEREGLTGEAERILKCQRSGERGTEGIFRDGLPRRRICAYVAFEYNSQSHDLWNLSFQLTFSYCFVLL